MTHATRSSGRRLADLRTGARIGTGSNRRRVQLAHIRPDLEFAGLRGNMHTRLAKAAAFDAIVVAAAALQRLGLAGDIAEILDPAVMVPQVAQGALGVECRVDDTATRELLAGIEDAASRSAVDAERAFLAELGGDCDLPAGAHATWVGEGLALDAILASPDGAPLVRVRSISPRPVRARRLGGAGRAGGTGPGCAVTVYLVGAGPGDPGLVTVRGAEVLGRADVVVFDRLSAAELLDLAPAAAQRIDVGKAPGRARISQSGINDLLVEHGRAGRTVVRLKGGDPFVFARGGEEAAALAAAGVSYEVVPGITSALAVPAYAGIPVTLRYSSTSFTVVTGHEDPDRDEGSVDWQAVARVGGTIIVLMGVARWPVIADAAAGRVDSRRTHRSPRCGGGPVPSSGRSGPRSARWTATTSRRRR